MHLTDAQRDFLNERRFAVLATSNPDGSVQQSVMWYILDGDTIIMNTAKGRIKYRNMENASRISICVEAGLTYLTLTGRVSFNDDQKVAQEDILRIGRRYDSEADVRAAHEKDWKHQQRVTLTMPIERVVAHGF